MPVYLVYFISDICNAKCKHCLLADGAHPNWEKPSLALTKQQLTLEEIDKVSASLGKGSLMFLLPTGGEPFLRKDIGEVIKIFHKNTGVPNVGIPTNGSMTARTVSIVEDVLESCPELDLHIDVSLDGVGKDHDDLRVLPGLFDKSIATYKALREVEKHYKNFSVQIETTVSSYNEDKLVENYDWFRENLDVDTVFTLLTRGKPKEPAAKFFDVAKYEEYAKLMERDYKSGSLKGYDTFPMADFINAKRIVRHKLIAKIVRDEQVPDPVLCRESRGLPVRQRRHLSLRAAHGPRLGNVRDVGYDFKKIWFSKEADEAADVHPRLEVLLHLRMLPHHQHPLQSPRCCCPSSRSGRSSRPAVTGATLGRRLGTGRARGRSRTPARRRGRATPRSARGGCADGRRYEPRFDLAPSPRPEVGLDPHAGCCQHADAVSDT